MHRRTESGVTVLEFALILPMLLTLVLGLFEVSRVLNTWEVLTAEAVEGARYGAVRFSDPAREPSISSDVATYVRSRAGLTLDGSRLGVTVAPSTTPGNKFVIVALTYQYLVTTPLIANLLPDPFTLRATAVMRGE